MGCKFQYNQIEIETSTPKSVAFIQVLDTILNYSYIFEYNSCLGLFGYIIDNCTFTKIRYYGLKSLHSQYIRITNSKFITEEEDSYSFERGCAINVKGISYPESEILNEIFNQSCLIWWNCIIVHVDNSEFVGSTGVTPGGVIQGEDIHLKITNSVFILTEHSNPLQIGGIFFQYVFQFTLTMLHLMQENSQE